MSIRTGIIVWLATGFGLGYSPVASGTAGALLGLWIVALLRPLDWGWQAGAIVALAALAAPICNVAERFFAKKDDGRIVADEYLTFPLCVIGLPWPEHPWLLAVAFVVNRLMDIVKPPPARRLQKLAGGAGIVADDVISCLYALAANHLIWLLISRWER
ncbi:MAG: phosphatidylglycerophosphatase A [Verrucomicrobiota bacterium]|nr:phosphatidylglycerophosphatase A [Verrucomicrobiota bacterium]